MDFKLDFSPRENPKPKEVASMTYEEAQQSLLTLGFKGIKREKAQIKTKYDWQPGHVIRTKCFFSTQYHGMPFKDIQAQPERFFAVHSYYTRPGEDFETLLAIYKPSPNTLIILHDHPISEYCTPWSPCKQVEWKD